MNNFNIIENAVNSYIKNADVTSCDDFYFINRLNKLILEKEDKRFNLKYTKKYSLKSIDKIVDDFLEQLNPEYRKYYEIRKNDGTIYFDKNKEKECINAYSNYDSIEHKRTIYIPLANTIEDAFAIVHELFHDINIDIEEESITRMFYTESLSILGEFLLEDYLKDNNIKDYKITNNYNLYEIKSKSIEIDFYLKLMTKYLENGYINKGLIFEILENYPSKYNEDLSNVILKIIYNEELDIDFEQPYIIGTLIASLMYDRIKKNKKNINELFELNEILKSFKFDDVLTYLDLDIKNNDLTEKSYKILDKCYIKMLKRNR